MGDAKSKCKRCGGNGYLWSKRTATGFCGLLVRCDNCEYETECGLDTIEAIDNWEAENDPNYKYE